MVNQTPRKQSPSKPREFPSAEMFIGFKKGWGGREVLINESKVKRAKLFFDDSPEPEEQEFLSASFKNRNTKEKFSVEFS